eukprot:352193-Chlamydomonas_euryale.AAC.15
MLRPSTLTSVLLGGAALATVFGGYGAAVCLLCVALVLRALGSALSPAGGRGGGERQPREQLHALPALAPARPQYPPSSDEDGGWSDAGAGNGAGGGSEAGGSDGDDWERIERQAGRHERERGAGGDAWTA